MQLHQIKSVHQLKKKRRVGRGGKRGSYSGRGVKGQKARAGHRIRPAERDLLIHIPKLRGVKNVSLKIKPTILNLKDLQRIFSNGDTVTKNALLEKGVIKKLSEPVKILGKGGLIKKLRIEKDVQMSKNASNMLKPL